MYFKIDESVILSVVTAPRRVLAAQNLNELPVQILFYDVFLKLKLNYHMYSRYEILNSFRRVAFALLIVARTMGHGFALFTNFLVIKV